MTPLLSWIRVARLQFYPLSMLILGCGALVASRETHRFLPVSFALTALCAILTEFITVITNEMHDYPTDLLNRNAGPFNGGSRVLVDGLLNLADLRRVRMIAAALLCLVAVSLWFVLPVENRVAALGLGLTGLLLGIGYTAPPLRLTTRGLGEFTVAFVHGFIAFLAGYLCQGAPRWAAFPWLDSIPIFLAILPSILLSGIPDREADAATGKRTVAVRVGPQITTLLALGASAAAAISLFLVQSSLFGAHMVFSSLLCAHFLVIAAALAAYLLRQCPGGRLDRLIILTLAYVPWFPIAALLS